MSKILVIGDNGNYSARTKMLAEILSGAGHEIVYDTPEPKPWEIIFDEYCNIPLTLSEKKGTMNEVVVQPSKLLVKLIGRIYED